MRPKCCQNCFVAKSSAFTKHETNKYKISFFELKNVIIAHGNKQYIHMTTAKEGTLKPLKEPAPVLEPRLTSMPSNALLYGFNYQIKDKNQ